MNELKQKLTSRKLWSMLVGAGIGIASLFGVEQNAAREIGGLVLVAVSVVAYILGEAWTDTAHMNATLMDAIADIDNAPTSASDTTDAE